jgi:hypothetical protein
MSMLRKKTRSNRNTPETIPQYTADMAHLLGEGRRGPENDNTSLLSNNKVILRKWWEAVLPKQVEKGFSN